MKKIAVTFVLVMVVLAVLPVALASAGGVKPPCPNDKWSLITPADGRYQDTRDRNENDQVCIRPVNGEGNTGTGFNIKDDKIPKPPKV